MTPSEIPAIETERLRLISLSIEMLRLLYAGELEAAGELGRFDIPESCSMPGGDHLLRRIEMIENDPAQHPWMNRAVVRKQDNLMVGDISFHHKAPDPFLTEFSDHAAELGYTIAPEFRRHRFATESALAMMEWAHRQHGVETFILSVSPANEPSLRMAELMGFRKVGEHMDEIDGLEFVMKGTLQDAPKARRSSPRKDS